MEKRAPPNGWFLHPFLTFTSTIVYSVIWNQSRGSTSIWYFLCFSWKYDHGIFKPSHFGVKYMISLWTNYLSKSTWCAAERGSRKSQKQYTPLLLWLTLIHTYLPSLEQRQVMKLMIRNGIKSFWTVWKTDGASKRMCRILTAKLILKKSVNMFERMEITKTIY